MPKDTSTKKAKAPTDMNATPAPAKKAAAKATSGEAKAKAVKPAKEKDPVKQPVAPEKVEAPEVNEVEKPAEVKVKAPARRPILTASEQRMMENAAGWQPWHPGCRACHTGADQRSCDFRPGRGEICGKLCRDRRTMPLSPPSSSRTRRS